MGILHRMITELTTLLDFEAFKEQRISDGTSFYSDDDIIRCIKFGENAQAHTKEESVPLDDFMASVSVFVEELAWTFTVSRWKFISGKPNWMFSFQSLHNSLN